jgi:hypothetical protein
MADPKGWWTLPWLPKECPGPGAPSKGKKIERAVADFRRFSPPLRVFFNRVANPRRHE